jgi:hypothetical protein
MELITFILGFALGFLVAYLIPYIILLWKISIEKSEEKMMKSERNYR